MDEAIKGLPEGLRTVLLMKVIGRMTSPQIGEALGIPAGTVRYRLSLARKRIARYLGMEEGL